MLTAIEIITSITNFIIQTISNSGYLGVFFLMVAESALIPIPSEIIMPFSGYLVSTGKFNIIPVILAGSIGNLVGSWIAYFIGFRLGREFILRYGRYVLLKKSHLEITESYFTKYGNKSAFISRLLPAVRTYISLPAGIAKMNFKKFSIYTIMGSLIWNTMLTYVGIELGNKWASIRQYSDYIDSAVIIGAIVVIVIFVKRYRKKTSP